MGETWLADLRLSGSLPEGLKAQTLLSPESPWLKGHFPGFPLLPGVAILALCQQSLAQSGDHRHIKGFSKVKFRQPVRPGESLSISLWQPDDIHQLRVKVTSAAGTVCSGLMLLG
jgi:3-hydroxymyristoyl/3-hydroxydecanoyl-(acyl carrier protein) dehydratase